MHILIPGANNKKITKNKTKQKTPKSIEELKWYTKNVYSTQKLAVKEE